ncbi:unnamed protein product [Nezara viridula]|uniref:Formin-binding protein 1-like n=1 Tax=Nezara viridula TaxID=85310 RepID=A0A9P0MS53_NEZVI|nr:unnamed protein product [Nezara viridula]
MMNEVNDLAGQHELIAENLQSEVFREVTILIKDFKDERKKISLASYELPRLVTVRFRNTAGHEYDTIAQANQAGIGAYGARMMGQLTSQIGTLERARKNYEKAAKEAERALDNYKRADADFNLSRAEVEKQRMNMTIKSQQCEEAKNEYADQLQRTNEQQRQHYQYKMPDVFRQLQELDEKRIRNIRNFMVHSVQVERNVFPIINQCLDGIVNAANTINEKEDSLLVIERYKSGFEPPGDIPFEDLNRVDGNHHPMAINPIPIAIVKPEPITVKGTMSASKLKKRGVLFGIFSSNKNNLSGNGDYKEDYSDLPPNQRKKKLQMKIDEIQAKIHQETAARDGLMKMKGVYEANSQLGDPMSIEGQLHESGQRLDKLRQELHKYVAFLEETGPVGATTPSHNSLNGIRRHHRNSLGSGNEDDSLSRSASDSSVANHKHSAPGTPLPNHGASDSPESGIGASHTSLPDSDDAPPPYYDTELLPPLGTCKALYPFEATSEGSMAMADGEELLVIEVDQGDGWTRVRRPADSTEGFVPTSYIQCFLNNC